LPWATCRITSPAWWRGKRWAEVGPKGKQRQDAGGGALVDEETEQIQGRRIDPVQIFHHKEDGLLRGNAQQDRQQRLQGPLLLLLGRQQQGRIRGRQWEGEQRRKEGYGLGQRQAILHQEALEFAEFLRRGLLPLEVECDPLQQLDPGIQGGVLVIRRTPAGRQPGLGLRRHLFLQHLHEARFANARFATEQHHLPGAVPDLCPALE
jgi:hypothetical protein